MDHLETSIVLVQNLKAFQNNQLRFVEVPTFDFLFRKHIIEMSDEWNAVDEFQPMDSPVSKTILFANGLRITSAFEKLVVSQDMKKNQSTDTLQKVVVKLLEKIKEVDYTGVGVNFLAVMDCENPGEEIKKRFLAPIPKLPMNKIIGGTVSYIYEMDETRVTMNISPVMKNVEGDGAENAIALSANYHFGVVHVKRIQGFIKEMSALNLDFKQQSQTLFG